MIVFCIITSVFAIFRYLMLGAKLVFVMEDYAFSFRAIEFYVVIVVKVFEFHCNIINLSECFL